MRTGDKEFYLKELNSNGCACEREKPEGSAFCKGCNRKLPLSLKQRIWRSMSDGNGGFKKKYPFHYEAAVKHLTDHTNRIKY